MTLYVAEAEEPGNGTAGSRPTSLLPARQSSGIQGNLLPQFGVRVMCFMPLVCGKFSNQRRNLQKRLALKWPSRVPFFVSFLWLYKLVLIVYMPILMNSGVNFVLDSLCKVGKTTIVGTIDSLAIDSGLYRYYRCCRKSYALNKYI